MFLLFAELAESFYYCCRSPSPSPLPLPSASAGVAGFVCQFQAMDGDFVLFNMMLTVIVLLFTIWALSSSFFPLSGCSCSHLSHRTMAIGPLGRLGRIQAFVSLTDPPSFFLLDPSIPFHSTQHFGRKEIFKKIFSYSLPVLLVPATIFGFSSSVVNFPFDYPVMALSVCLYIGVVGIVVFHLVCSTPLFIDIDLRITILLVSFPFFCSLFWIFPVFSCVITLLANTSGATISKLHLKKLVSRPPQRMHTIIEQNSDGMAIFGNFRIRIVYWNL